MSNPSKCFNFMQNDFFLEEKKTIIVLVLSLSYVIYTVN